MASQRSKALGVPQRRFGPQRDELLAQRAVRRADIARPGWLDFLPETRVVRAATDERNFVKKAVNWALRQIGKRNADLNRAAIECAEEIHALDSKSARWIAAVPELTATACRAPT